MSNVATIELLFAALLSGDKSVVPVLEDAILEGVADAGKATYMLIEQKAWKRYGTEHPAKRIEARFAVVTPGKSIRLVGLGYPKGDRVGDHRPYDRTFVIGETAEYDSFNFAYHGTIKAIGAGGHVTILKDHSKRSARLDAEQFTSRNYDLDLVAAAERRHDVMMHC